MELTQIPQLERLLIQLSFAADRPLHHMMSMGKQC